MSELLIILSPPRSFSSIVSTMIGEHPDLYGFPELHLFVGDTVQEVFDFEYKLAKRYSGPHGLLRTLAQIHDGFQTTGSIMRAVAWLNERKDWSTKKLMDYLLEKISPLMGLEKSPPTARKSLFIERVYSLYPQAYFLHLTRHPVSTRQSWQEFDETIKNRKLSNNKSVNIDKLLAWYQVHLNIIKFTNTLPVGQSMRIKGEDILSYPDIYLPQIAEWLGVRTDQEAIEAMKHPENSPYACVGPPPATMGNDWKFMQRPHLRSGRIKEPSLIAFFRQEKLQWLSPQFEEILLENELKLASEQEIITEITNLAGVLGYQ